MAALRTGLERVIVSAGLTLAATSAVVLLGVGGVTPAYAADLSFAPAVDVGIPSSGVATGDLDADGALDLVCTTSDTGDSVFLAVLLGDGSGGFSAPATFPAGTAPHAKALADLDEDGDLDVVVGDRDSMQVHVLLGDGAGGLGAATSYDVPVEEGYYLDPEGVAVGDVDEDGHLDVVTANRGSASISVLLGDGTGVLGSPSRFSAGDGAGPLALCDLDGDGHLDAVTTDLWSDQVLTLLGDGSGAFGAATGYAVGWGPNSLAICDLNGDGHHDAVTGSVWSENVSVLLGDGSGGFGAASNAVVLGRVNALAPGDLDHDGDVDLAVSDADSELGPSVLLGDGTGGLGAPVQFAGPYFREALALGDLDGDGYLDIVSGGMFAVPGEPLLGSLSVLLNTTAPAAAHYEQSDAMIAYGGSGWTTATGTNFSAGSLRYASSGGFQAAFTGTGIDLVALTGPTYGIATVTVDGTDATAVDLYSETYAYKQTIFSRQDLTNGPHTIKVELSGRRNAASTATRLNIDAIDVVGTLTQADAWPPVLTHYEQGDTKIAYGGSGWTTAAGTRFSAGSLRCASSGGFQAAFTGTGIDLVALTGPTYGIATVTVDGTDATAVDLYSEAYGYKQIVFSRQGLTNGPHTIKVAYTGRRNVASTSARLNIDAIDVVGTLTQADAWPPVLTRYEQGDTKIAYGGTGWTTATGTRFSEGSLRYASGGGFQAAFTGIGIDLVALTGPTYGIATVTVDGTDVSEIDLYSEAYGYKQIVFSRHGLANGPHTIKVAYTGRRNVASTSARLNIDALDVVGTLTQADAW